MDYEISQYDVKYTFTKNSLTVSGKNFNYEDIESLEYETSLLGDPILAIKIEDGITVKIKKENIPDPIFFGVHDLILSYMKNKTEDSDVEFILKRQLHTQERTQKDIKFIKIVALFFLVIAIISIIFSAFMVYRAFVYPDSGYGYGYSNNYDYGYENS